MLSEVALRRLWIGLWVERLYAEDEYLADEYELYIFRRAGDCAHLERERVALILGED